MGANHPVVLPQGSVKTDWEVELGIVIGSIDLLEVEGDDNRELRDAALTAARRGNSSISSTGSMRF